MKIFSFGSKNIDLSVKNIRQKAFFVPENADLRIKDSFEKKSKSQKELSFSGYPAEVPAKQSIAVVTSVIDAAQKIINGKLPVEEMQKAIEETLNKLKIAPDLKSKGDVLLKFNDFKSQIQSYILEAKSSMYEPKTNKHSEEISNLLGALHHEMGNLGLLPHIIINISAHSKKPKPLQKNFIQECEKDLGFIVETMQRYQIFLDKGIYKPDFPISQLLVESLMLINGKAKSVSIEGGQLLNRVKPNISNTDFYTIQSNILQNAAKYSSGKGDIKIKFELAKSDDNRDILNFIVEDNGIGIPEDQISSITKGIRATNTGEFYGTGYGLKRISKILAYQGTKIRIESELGKGTKITCPIPVSLIPEGQI